jgi:hypothetical protein
MTLAWAIIIVAVSYLLGKLLGKHLRGLSVLLDESLANQIIEAERIKTAEARLELYDSDASEERHMCITTACRNPVVGRWIFAHCKEHLERYERRWLEEKIEDGGVKRPANDEPVHELVKGFQEAIKSRDKELARQNALKKDAALAEARDLLEKARSQQRERYTYLPPQLLRKIEEARERALQAVGMAEDGETKPARES